MQKYALFIVKFGFQGPSGTTYLQRESFGTNFFNIYNILFEAAFANKIWQLCHRPPGIDQAHRKGFRLPRNYAWNKGCRNGEEEHIIPPPIEVYYEIMPENSGVGTENEGTLHPLPPKKLKNINNKCSARCRFKIQENLFFSSFACRLKFKNFVLHKCTYVRIIVLSGVKEGRWSILLPFLYPTFLPLRKPCKWRHSSLSLFFLLHIFATFWVDIMKLYDLHHSPSLHRWERSCKESDIWTRKLTSGILCFCWNTETL